MLEHYSNSFEFMSAAKFFNYRNVRWWLRQRQLVSVCTIQVRNYKYSWVLVPDTYQCIVHIVCCLLNNKVSPAWALPTPINRRSLLAVRRLKGRFIKFETVNRHYRPMQQEYGSAMPCVNFDTRPEMCPFAATVRNCVPPLPAVVERAEMGDGGKEEEEEWEGITTAGASKTQHPPTGRRQVCG